MVLGRNNDFWPKHLPVKNILQKIHTLASSCKCAWAKKEMTHLIKCLILMEHKSSTPVGR